MATTGTNLTSSPFPLVTCPSKHVTHVFLACDLQSVCGGEVTPRGLSCTVTCKSPASTTSPYFTCQTTGEHVSYSVLCDWRHDCGDQSDETFCEFPPCRWGMFDCGRKQCLAQHNMCDREMDCPIIPQPSPCRYINKYTYFNVTKPPAVVNFDRPGSFSLIPLAGHNPQCPETHYQCPGDGYCLPVYTRCNDIHDCPGHEDEAACDSYTCAGLYRCRGLDRTICMHVNHLCDDVPNCPQHDDELMCKMAEGCPDRSQCYGTHFHRPETALHLRYLEARGTGLTLDAIIDNTMLIHLGVGACGWWNISDMDFINLHVFDLSDNHLRVVGFEHLTSLKTLKELVLAGNPLSTTLSALNIRYRFTSLLLLNLSQVPDQASNLHVMSHIFPRVQILDVSQSGLKSLTGKHLFQSLKVLDLQGCPISDFSPEFMKGMRGLQQVFADNYKLCCSVMLPSTFTGHCVSSVDEMSSCEHLLMTTFYRFAVSAFTLVAILGNLGTFVYRVHTAGKNKPGYLVFVIHLSLSDFLMGVYLLIIGVADRVYGDGYLWSDVAWKTSLVCTTAGFLSFISVLIFLITLDRFLVIRFPFHRLRFGITSAQTACTVSWGLGLVLASVPLLPVTSHWRFYSQTGICIPLPVTRADFPGHHYSFSIMIVVNLVMFLLIGAGQGLIYWSIRANAISSYESESKDNHVVKEGARSKELVVGRRLLVIAMSDFLCWFPIGACRLLAKLNVAVSAELNMALAIIALPLNSALNPFLYTYVTLRQIRQKRRENSLLKLINARVKHEMASRR